MRVAIITDSNSGITQSQAKEKGAYVLPMSFMIDRQTHYEDVDLIQQQSYQKLGDGSGTSTSQPLPDAILTLRKDLLKEYEQIVHVLVSSGLSGSRQTALILAQGYEGQVFVVNNQRISMIRRRSVMDAKAMADRGISGEEIQKMLEDIKFDSSIYIIVDTSKYLKKGGGITPAAATLGTPLKTKLVLTTQGEKLDTFSKVRAIKQAKSTMVTAIAKDMEERPGDKTGKGLYLEAAHTANEKAVMEFKRELEEVFPEAGEVYMDALSPSVSCHIGPGTLVVACTKKLDILKDERVPGKGEKMEEGRDAFIHAI